MQNQLLLVEDVDGVGRKGDLIKVKPGFARNFLLPQKKAVVAEKRTLRMQERLQKEREEQAIRDRADSEAIKARLEGKSFETIVKVDHEGHMYGSVSHADIVELIKEKEGIALERRNVRIGTAFKTLGTHVVPLALKEGVTCEVALHIKSDRPLEVAAPKEEAKEEAEEAPSEAE